MTNKDTTKPMRRVVQFDAPAARTKPLVVAPSGKQNPDSTRETSSDACLKCHKKSITYECDPCGCPSFCTDCARKLASGGKCKTCHEMYANLRRIRPQ
mmetsp:Transcript_118459/g.242092  ORF Transcript_118459/g.242092 Transcript_118459/m.242092 type:complete len:98 (-) Transcript_118459:179-472(-)